MASLAEQLVGSALESSQKGPDLAGALSSGMQQGSQIAQHIEQVRQNRAELEQKKEAIQTAKLQKFGDDVSKIHEFKDSAARSGYVKFLKSQNQQLKLGVPDEALDFAFAGPDNIARVGTLQTMVGEGTITGPQAISILQDPSKFAEIVPKNKYLEANGDQFKGADMKDVDVQDASDKIAKAAAERQNNLAQAQRSQSYATQAETRKDDQSAQAVERINNDSAMTALTQQARNIQKGKALLNDKNHPPSWVTLNEIAQDYSAALSGKGTGSDFKLKEIKKESIAQHLGDIATFVSSNPDQPASPEAIAFWQHFGDRLDSQYNEQIGARARQKGREAKIVYKNNPAAVEAVGNVVKSFEDGSWSGAQPMLEVHGQKMTKDQADAFFKQFPQYLTPELKKQLEK